MASCTPDKGVSRRRISSPAPFLMMVNEIFRNACRIRSAVGLSAIFCLFSGCKPGSLACSLSRDRRRTNLQYRQHADAERQQVREALDVLVALDKQRRDMDAALETIAEAFDTVFVAVTQHRLLQRQPRVHRVGDKGLPTEPLGEGGDGVSLAGNAGDGVAHGLEHPLLTARSAPASAHILGFSFDLFFPCNTEQPVHSMVLQNGINGLSEGRFVGDLPLAPTSWRRHDSQSFLRMA